MGKSTGFLEYERVENAGQEPLERIKTYREFHTPLALEERQKQGARCMDCGVPFCQAGKPIFGMVSGCPLNNLCPEWNDMVYKGFWDEAADRLLLTNCFPEFTSRVCPALCEKACTCGLNGDPVTVKENEYAIVESRRIRRRPVPENVSQLLVPAPPVWQRHCSSISVVIASPCLSGKTVWADC